MKTLLLIVMLGAIAVLGFMTFQKMKGKYDLKQSRESATNQNGFTDIVMPGGTKEGTVYIFAPVNCPREAGQNADKMERVLRKEGIPVERKNKLSLNAPVDKKELLNITASVINQGPPFVCFNGKGASNPEVSQILKEFKH